MIRIILPFTLLLLTMSFAGADVISDARTTTQNITSDTTVTSIGSVIVDSGRAIESSTDNINLTIDSGGIVESTVSDAIDLSSSDGMTVTNYGTITAGDYGVHADSGLIINRGVITGGSLAAIRADGNADSITITNSGTFNGGASEGIVYVEASEGGTTDVTLNLETGSILQGVKTFTLDPSATNTLNLSGTGPTDGESADFTGFGILNVNADKWKLSFQGTQTIPTVNVTTGILEIASGSTLSPTTAMTVNSEGTLMGLGTVTDTLDVYGTLAPGASIGTMTFTTLNLNATSTTEIEFDSTSTDVLNVTGTATIDPDATVQFIPLGELITAPVALNNFITATTLTTEFDTVEISPLFNYSVTYSGNNAAFEITSLNTFASVGGTQVQKDIEKLLATFPLTSVTGNLNTVILSLQQQVTRASLLSALDSLSPEMYTTLYPMTLEGNYQFIQGLSQRMDNLRYQNNPNPRTLLTDSECRPKTWLDILRLSDCWKSFGSIRGHHGKMRSTEGFTGYQSLGAGALLGIHRCLSPGTLLGFGLEGGLADIDWASDKGDGSRYNLHFGAFLSKTVGPSYWDNTIAFGVNFFNVDRRVSIPNFTDSGKDKFSSQDIALSSHGGYCFPCFMGIKNLSLTLKGGLDFVALFQGRIRERDMGNVGVAIKSDRQQSLKTNLGASLSYSNYSCRVPLIFEATGLWRMEALDRHAVLDAQFRGTGSYSAIHGRKLDAHSMLIEGNMIALATENCKVYISYRAHIGDNLYTHNLSAGVNINF